MPAGAVYVGRPTKWGNPYRVDEFHTIQWCVDAFRGTAMWWLTRDWNELRGKDLVCWCPLDQPCHADVLLEMANA